MAFPASPERPHELRLGRLNCSATSVSEEARKSALASMIHQQIVLLSGRTAGENGIELCLSRTCWQELAFPWATLNGRQYLDCDRLATRTATCPTIAGAVGSTLSTADRRLGNSSICTETTSIRHFDNGADLPVDATQPRRVELFVEAWIRRMGRWPNQPPVGRGA
jgi:hypothetical protein